MHILENQVRGNIYCNVAECNWNPSTNSYDKPTKGVGKLDIEGRFVPNKYLSSILVRESNDPESINKYEQLIINTVKKKYGDNIKPGEFKDEKASGIDNIIKTATIIHFGPQLVFDSITSKYKLCPMLIEAFGKNLTQDILSLAWYITSEGSALSNNDSWLDYFESPRGYGFSSQEVTKLLDLIDYDGIMTFYKLWLKGYNSSDKALYDLTSISYYGAGINAADWGYNRDQENLPQVNYALLVARGTAMPLFAWPLNGSVSDIGTLENTLQFLEKLGYKPNCLMLDRAFPSISNIGYMLRRRYTFLQALKVNSKWICDIIDFSESIRYRPDSMLKTDDRTYYVSSTELKWVRYKKTIKNKTKEESFFYQCKTKGDRYKPQDGDGIEVIEQYPCHAHILFCQDLVGNSWDRFMGNLNNEYERLLSDPSAEVKPEFKPFFFINKPKYARKRVVDFNTEAITKHKNKYVGYICFLTNDLTIKTAGDALAEYSTRDYIEKDFDEMKNDLDMRRIRVHTDSRMRARLFIQFIAEIYLREIRFQLHQSEECRKMTKTQIFSHLKTISKVRFQGKYNDVIPQLSKKQRSILEALNIIL